MGSSAALRCIDPEVSGKCGLNEAALSLDPGIHSGTGTSGKGVKSQEPGSLEILFDPLTLQHPGVSSPGPLHELHLAGHLKSLLSATLSETPSPARI